MVVNVSDKEISTKEIKTGKISTIPYGMAVWSTGIATRPVVMDFMKQIGQVMFCSLSSVGEFYKYIVSFIKYEVMCVFIYFGQ